MTPAEAWDLRCDGLQRYSDEVILLRLQHALRNKPEDSTLERHASITYPEALKRPACVAKLVEWKLKGLI